MRYTAIIKRFITLKKTAAMIFAVLAFVAAASLSCTASQENDERMVMAVTIAPQVEFARGIAGDAVAITAMVPPGASPHTYEPTPSQIKVLSHANLYAKVGSGVEFELAWMDKLAAINTDMAIVDCARGIELMEMAAGEEHDDHEGQEAHEHGTLDPHIWMSPRNAAVMVRNMAEGLIEADPAGEDLYRRNSDNYIAQLQQLDRDIIQGMEDVRNRIFMVYHPSFGYLARDYGLTMLPIEEEGKDPSPAGLAKVITQAREHDIKVVFASPQFNPQSAQVIAESIDGIVVFIDPLAENYMENFRNLTQQLIEAME